MATALVAIANGDPNSYYTGKGLVDADICAVGFKTGMFMSEALAQNSLGGGSNQKPTVYLGWDFPRFVSSLIGGSPSGGN
jgi:hypothetical protein